MRDALAVLGIVAVVACLWLFLLTVRQGGVRQQDPDTGQTEVLTFSGWQPEGAAVVDSGQKQSAAALVAQAPPPTAPPPPPTEVPAPTNPPEPTAAPPPTQVPAPTQTPPATVAALAEAPAQPTIPANAAPAPPSQGDLPAGWAQDPTGASFYVADPAPVSPWNVLGWLLVGALPVGGLLTASLLSYRHFALTNARAEAIRAAQSPAARSIEPEPQAEPEWAEELDWEAEEEDFAGAETDIEAYLGPAPQGSAA